MSNRGHWVSWLGARAYPRYMSEQTPGRSPLVDGPNDPELDPRAAYALERDYVAGLTKRLLASSGTTAELTSPGRWAAACSHPAVEPCRRGRGLRRAPNARPSRVADHDRRARGRDAARAARHRPGSPGRDHRPDRLGVNGKARKDAFDEALHIALTARYYGRTAHQHLDSERKLGVVPGLTRVEVNHVPKGVVGIISPVELPLHLALCDGLAGGAGWQRRGDQAGRPDHADGPAGC